MPLNIDEFLQNPTAIEFNSFKKADLRLLAEHLNILSITTHSTKEDIRRLLLPLITFDDKDVDNSVNSDSSKHNIE